MIKIFVTALSVMCLASAHEVHTGQCPGFTPMAGFDWEKVSLASLVEEADGVVLMFYCICVHKTLLRCTLSFSDYSFPPVSGT